MQKQQTQTKKQLPYVYSTVKKQKMVDKKTQKNIIVKMKGGG